MCTDNLRKKDKPLMVIHLFPFRLNVSQIQKIVIQGGAFQADSGAIEAKDVVNLLLDDSDDEDGETPPTTAPSSSTSSFSSRSFSSSSSSSSSTRTATEAVGSSLGSATHRKGRTGNELEGESGQRFRREEDEENGNQEREATKRSARKRSRSDGKRKQKDGEVIRKRVRED